MVAYIKNSEYCISLSTKMCGVQYISCVSLNSLFFPPLFLSPTDQDYNFTTGAGVHQSLGDFSYCPLPLPHT